MESRTLIALAACSISLAPATTQAQFSGLSNLLNRATSAVSSAPSLDTSTVTMSGQQMLDDLRQIRRGFSVGKPPLLFDPSELQSSAAAAPSGGIGSLFSSLS